MTTEIKPTDQMRLAAAMRMLCQVSGALIDVAGEVADTLPEEEWLQAITASDDHTVYTMTDAVSTITVLATDKASGNVVLKITVELLPQETFSQ